MSEKETKIEEEYDVCVVCGKTTSFKKNRSYYI